MISFMMYTLVHTTMPRSPPLRLALEPITDDSLPTMMPAGLTLELLHRHGGQGLAAMVLRLGVVHLVHGHRGVHHRGLDGLPLDDGLNSLVHVVVAMLTADGRRNRLRVLCLAPHALVLELCGFLLEACLQATGVAVVVLAVLDRDSIMVVLFGKDLLVFDGLDGGVVI